MVKLKNVIEGEDELIIERTIKETEELFIKINQMFPHQEFLIEAESKFNEILQNSPKAIELLEKAYGINKRSPYLCSRLADVYEKNNNYDEALKTLEETLKIIKEAHEKVINLLKDNRDLLIEISEKLLEKETLMGNEFMEMVKGDKSLENPSVEEQD